MDPEQSDHGSSHFLFISVVAIAFAVFIIIAISLFSKQFSKQSQQASNRGLSVQAKTPSQ